MNEWHINSTIREQIGPDLPLTISFGRIINPLLELHILVVIKSIATNVDVLFKGIGNIVLTVVKKSKFAVNVDTEGETI